MSAQTQIDWWLFSPMLVSRMGSAAVIGYVYPFMPSYIASFNLAPDDVARYAGLADGLLPVVEGLCCIPGARLCDRFGRRRALMISTAWVAIITVCTGFSTSVRGIILCRVLCGLNAVGVSNRTMLGELATDGNRLKMFGWYVPAFAFGFSLASMIGGSFALPEGHIPVLGELQVFIDYPYALPGVITAIIPAAGTLLTFLWAKETRVPLQSTSHHSGSTKHQTRPIKDVFTQRGIIPIIFINLMFCMMDTGFIATFSICGATAVDAGGLGLSMPVIGLMLGLASALYATLAPFAAPTLVRRIGRLRALQMFLSTCPVVALSFPILIALNHYPSMVTLGLLLQVVIRVFGGMGWTVTDVLLAECVHPSLRASSSEVFMIAGCTGRSLGPIIFSSLFGLSIRAPKGSLGRSVVWIIMFAASLLPIVACFFVSKETPKITSGPETEELLAVGHDA